jgi:hypothetical protein
MTVEIEAGGRNIGASVQLGALPRTVTSIGEPWTTILDESVRALILRASSVRLNVRVGRLASRSWELERPVRACWWVRQGNELSLSSEFGDLKYGVVAATAPHLSPKSRETCLNEDVQLLVPIGFDAADFGPETAFTTYCLASPRGQLEIPAIQKPRTQRRRHAQDMFAGLEDLIEAYLRWSLGETDNVVAELKRRQIAGEIDSWIAELCCGSEWIRREKELLNGDPWQLLIRCCEETGVGLDSYVELGHREERELIRRAVTGIRERVPDLWMRLGPSCEFSNVDSDQLDDACIRAYEQLSIAYRGRGLNEVADKLQEGDPSADTSPEKWNDVLGQVKAQMEMYKLAELVIPTDLAQYLVALDAASMSLDELAEEFCRCVTKARKSLAGALPSDESLRAIITLWAEPEVAVGLDWRGSLDTLIVERSIARVARYLALKKRRETLGAIE